MCPHLQQRLQSVTHSGMVTFPHSCLLLIPIRNPEWPKRLEQSSELELELVPTHTEMLLCFLSAKIGTYKNLYNSSRQGRTDDLQGTRSWFIKHWRDLSVPVLWKRSRAARALTKRGGRAPLPKSAAARLRCALWRRHWARGGAAFCCWIPAGRKRQRLWNAP